MDFSIAEIDDYGLFPPPWALSLGVAFVVSAVLAGRRSSPYWLVLVWASACLVGISLALAMRWPLDWHPLRQLLEICLRVSAPVTFTSAALLWWREANAAQLWSDLGIAAAAFVMSVHLTASAVEFLYPGLYISGLL